MNKSDIREDFIKECVVASHKHPSVIGIDGCKCCCDGIVVTFKAKSNDSHNYDFNPLHAEWVSGLFPNKKTGAIHIKETGDVEFVGEDDFIGKYRLEYPWELTDLIKFYADTRRYTKLRIKYRKQPIGSLFHAAAKGNWIGLALMDGVISACIDNKLHTGLKSVFRCLIPLVPATEMPITFLAEYFIHYIYGNHELQETLFRATNGYQKKPNWKDAAIIIPATREQQLKWAVEHRMVRIFNERRMGYERN